MECVSADVFAKLTPVSLWHGLTWSQHRYTAVSALGHALVLALVFSIPTEPKSLALDPLRAAGPIARVLVTPKVPPETTIAVQLPGAGPRGGGQRHQDREGAMGDPKAKQMGRRTAIAGGSPTPQLARELATKMALRAGVLRQLGAMQGSHVASLWERARALGPDAENLLGNLIGSEPGSAYGNNALGLAGPGLGGGGDGRGTYGLDKIHTNGSFGEGGGGRGYGVASKLPGKPSTVLATLGEASVCCALDKSIVRRVVRQHLNEIRFCYEQEAIAHPDLAGRVQVQFTIAQNGRVSLATIASSTMGDRRVDECIAQAVRRWEFPQPQRGGIVIVTYPFVLQLAGG